MKGKGSAIFIAAVILCGLFIVAVIAARDKRSTSANGAAMERMNSLYRLQESLKRSASLSKGLRTLPDMQKALDAIRNMGKATKLTLPSRGTPGPAAPAAPPAPKTPSELARFECEKRRCYAAIDQLARVTPRGADELSTLKALWPQALREVSGEFPNARTQNLFTLAADVGLHVLRDEWLDRLWMEECQKRRRCIETALRLPTEVLDDTLRTSLLRRILPQAMLAAVHQNLFATGRRLALMATEAGVSFVSAEYEARLNKAALSAVMMGQVYRAPSIYADAFPLAAGHSVPPKHARTLVRGADGREYARFEVRNDQGVGYALASAIFDSKYGSASVRRPGVLDTFDILWRSDLPSAELGFYWKALFKRTLLPPLLFLFLYLLVTVLFAPRWTAKLLWLLRLRRLARLLARWACHRRRGGNPALLLGPAIDLARYVDVLARRPLTAERRRAWLEQAEHYLRAAAYLKPLASAWLARILLLQGRVDEALTAAETAYEKAPCARSRLELARAFIAQGRVASAASLMDKVSGPLAWTLEAMYLRAVTLAHAGRVKQAQRWLAVARLSGAIRRQSLALMLAIRRRASDTAGAERAAQRAAKAGVAMAAASVWLARLARSRGEGAQAKRWAEAGLTARPHDVLLEIEAALASPELAAIIDVVRRHPRSAAALHAAYAAANERGVSHPYLSERLEEDLLHSDMRGAGHTGAHVLFAKGDYARQRGDEALAVSLWARAARDDKRLADTVRERALVLFDEALADDHAERALAIARSAGLDANRIENAETAALHAWLSRARRGLPVSHVKAPTHGPIEARALWHVLRGETRRAAELLATQNTDASQRIVSLLASDRALTDGEQAALQDLGGASVSARNTPLQEGLQALRGALTRRDVAAALTALDVVRGGLRLGAHPQAEAALVLVEASLRVQANAEERAQALERLAALHPDRELRALAMHDRALALTPPADNPRRVSHKRWRAYAEAWDATLADPAYIAHVQRRILELDDPRLGADHAAELLAVAEQRVAERLVPFLRARVQDGEAAPLWVHESRSAERAAQSLIEARTHDVEAALEQAAKNRSDPRLAPATWRNEGRVMLEGTEAVALLAVAKERADALRERVAGALINLGVDANAIAAYDDAVEITEKARELAQNPEHVRLCEGNVAIYRNNRAQKLPAPGR